MAFILDIRGWWSIIEGIRSVIPQRTAGFLATLEARCFLDSDDSGDSIED